MHAPGRTVAGFREQVATRLVFFVVGTSVGAWAPLVPFAKELLGVDDAALGLLLLCLGVGSVLTMPLTGILVGRHGCRIVILAAGVVLFLAMPFLVLASSGPALAAALFAFGGAMGTMDVAMNVQAVLVEKDARRPLMSGFHGLWSVGGIAGASLVSGLLWLGASPLASALCVVVLGAALLVVARPNLLPYGNHESDVPLFVLPRGVVLFIGLLCFIIFLAEGVVLDWGALFLKGRGMDAATAGLGYAAFAAMMTLGRLAGDRIVAALGGFRILLIGGLAVALGYGIVIFSPSPLVGILGFALVGAGAANIVPILFTATGRQTVMPGSHAVSAVTTIGYAGVLLGPAVVGFIADETSLEVSFAAVAALALIVAASARIGR